MVDKERADQISGAVFLIGLGVLFLTPLDFWPGILFVIGASSIARGTAEGQAWYTVSGGLWMIGLGLLFLLNFSFPVLLILIGLSILLGYQFQSRKQNRCREDSTSLEELMIEEKPKNGDKRKNSDPQYRIEY